MTKILVTGGTGVLGREIVRELSTRANVRVLSRSAPVSAAEPVEVVRGDLESGEGLTEALAGVDVVVHAASSGTDMRRMDRDVGAARNLLEAAEGCAHVVYISIVGVDAVPHAYYRAKLAVERMIEESGTPWTTLRTTQFHDLVLMFCSMMSRPPVAISPRGMRVQPVDAGEVAVRMAELALGDPAGRVPDMGGPRVEHLDDLMRAYLTAVRRRRPLVRVPLPGKVAAAYRAGHHLTPENAVGVRTFTEDLIGRARTDGRITPPYRLSR